MLNQNLTEEELHTDLHEFLEAFNFMFTQIEPDRDATIFQDKKLLATIHHSLNIEKYQQKTFRQRLLVGAPDDKIREFAKTRDMDPDTLKESQSIEFRNKLGDFKWSNNLETANFVKIFGYPDYLIPGERDEIQAEEIMKPSNRPFEQLKDYQAEVVFNAIEYVKIPNSKFLIHMPTGAGKTRVAMEVISDFLNSADNRQVVWLADKMELCEQAAAAFFRVWSHLGKSQLKLYRIWGEGTEIPHNIDGTAFIVAMYQKIREPLRQKQLDVKADLIVPDEAHNAIASTYVEIIECMKDRRSKQTRIMGLTATPGRGSSDIEESTELSRFFNGRVVSIDAERGVIDYLQRKKILSRCSREQLKTNIQYTLTKKEWDSLSKSFDHEFPVGLLEKIANDQSRNLIIIRRLVELAKVCKHVIVFCGSIKQSKLLSGFMIVSGYSAAHIDGTSPTNYRRDTVDKFRNGDLQFIFNYGVFTAGFDSPNIDAVVIARPTKSIVLYGQMIGRGMRGPGIGGTEEFQLIDVVDNIITEYGGLDNVYEYFSEYWS